MAKTDREEVLSTLAARLFAAMVDDVVMDAALQSHQEVARNRAVCEVCHTKCGQAHASGSVALAAQGALGTPRQGTPVGEKVAGTSTPTAKDGTIYLECVNCSRQMASNRYASHLSSCMGLGTGARRGAARSVNVKAKAGDGARSASPYLGSESGNVSDDSGPPQSQSQQAAAPKKKGRPPKKKDEGETALNRKRPGSPQLSPNKNKKQKTNGSPLSRVRTEKTGSASNNLLPPPPTNSQSKVPSRLRESSTASFLEREASSSSRSSSPATLAVNATTPSSAHSAASFGAKPKKNGMVGKKSKPGVRLPSPPRPPRPPTPVMRRPETDYLVDVEGDETGSSTDTDSE